ncbi:class I SAM-dependent methyltransferase [Nocardia abscessus]|uniref:Class I SAM-dependent methyltransferase n=1 Tax=Nocardia abscessus TaxID=120957 RepID=A0ABS0CIS7_9NOCA|nr:class I SAM-dependent methyltransferase [Nocardia abscessus]MBF6228509.1 class I SAM-dependent methyltransferase [Nocardia abscessus]
MRDRPPTAAILGCADGKFVLPAARRGFEVAAVDIDEVALYGGMTKAADGTEIEMPGLRWRLETEQLEQRVSIIRGDLASVQVEPCDFVFISGALQYSYNLKHQLFDTMSHVRSLVAPGGLLAIEYMLPVTEAHAVLDTHPSADQWPSFFPRPEWTVLANRVAEPAHEHRPGASVLGTHRFLQWGYITAQKGVSVS